VHIKAATEAKIYHPQRFSGSRHPKKEKISTSFSGQGNHGFPNALKQMPEGFFFFGVHLVEYSRIEGKRFTRIITSLEMFLVPQ